MRIDGGDALRHDDASVFSVRRSDPRARSLCARVRRFAFGDLLRRGAEGGGRTSFILQSVSAGAGDRSRSIAVRIRGAFGHAGAAVHLRTHAGAIRRQGRQCAHCSRHHAARHARIPLWGGRRDSAERARLSRNVAALRRPSARWISAIPRLLDRNQAATTAAGQETRSSMRLLSIRGAPRRGMAHRRHAARARQADRRRSRAAAYVRA